MSYTSAEPPEIHQERVGCEARAGAVTSPLYEDEGETMAQHRMRIGVVGANGGTDRWGARAHLPAIAALEEAELVAVCTVHEETAKRAQQRTGARLAFWDYREMMRSPEVELVTVAVRSGLEHPEVMEAWVAGK